MGRGFLAGIFWGAIVGIALLFVSSQALERQQLSFPQPEASAVEVPGGSEFDQARAEADPVLPETDARPAAEGIGGVVPPEDAVETPPSFDTTALEMPEPEIEAPGGLGELPALEDDVPVPAIGGADDGGAGASEAESALLVPETPGDAPQAGTDAPDAAEMPEADAETQESVAGSDTAPEVSTDVAALPGPEADDGAAPDTDTPLAVQPEDDGPDAMAQPEIGDEPSLPQPELTADAPETPAAPEMAPQATDDSGSESFFQPVESIGNLAEEVETGRLPRITETAPEAPEPSVATTPEADTETADGGEASTLPTILRPGAEPEAEEPVEEAAADEAETEDMGAPTGPALTAYAVPFENPEALPLVSIVLVETAETPLEDQQIDSLPDAIGFAIDSGASSASVQASRLRAAGREVALIPSLPTEARPQDVEQALRVNFERVPEAVAVIDVSGGSFQSDRQAVAQIVDIVAASGHGLVTYPRGLNTAHQQAGRAGVPTGLIFRNLDGNGESAEQIRRTLDRAAFRARQNEAVILVGSTDPETVAAVVEWAVENQGGAVKLAPLSAALRRQ